MDTTHTPLKELAKRVRRTLKAAGVKASVRCSGSSQHETLRVDVTAVSGLVAAEVEHGADDFDGQISSAKAYSNSVIRVVGRLVGQHVASIDGYRFVTIVSKASRFS